MRRRKGWRNRRPLLAMEARKKARRRWIQLRRRARVVRPAGLPPPPSAPVSRVGLLEVDSTTVLVFWEAAPVPVAAARKQVRDPDAGLFLRFREISSGGAAGELQSFEREAGAFEGAETISLERPPRLLRCELGVKGAGGGFAVLARSNTVQLPRPREPERYEHLFRDVRPQLVPQAAAAPAAPASTPPVWERRTRDEAGAPEGDGRARGPAVAEAAVDHHKDAARASGPLATAATLVGGRGAVVPLGVHLGAADLVEGFLEAREVQGEESGREEAQALAIERITQRSPAPSSADLSSPPPPVEMDLDLHADLVVYGRGRPGAVVYVAGAPVTVRADGTFEARLALPGTSRDGRGRGGSR